jgi:hypothetical protein
VKIQDSDIIKPVQILSIKQIQVTNPFPDGHPLINFETGKWIYLDKTIAPWFHYHLRKFKQSVR